MIKRTITNLCTFISIMGVLACPSLQAKSTANNWLDYYTIEDIKMPKGVDPQIGGLEVLKDGRIAAAFHDGNLLIYSPVTKKWATFASGLHEPLGIKEDKNGALIVAQMPELTRLIDEDGDGQADVYQTISDDFGISGNFHEFAFGPAVDSKGNMYISLNLAANRNGVFEYTRGDYSDLCPPKEEMENWHNDKKWKSTRKKLNFMFSCLQYRGWILKITPDGKTIPYASGVRSPNGIHIDEQYRMWVTDNQGDWIATSPIHLVNEGDFLGHPSSLYWKKGWKTDVLNIKPESIAHLKKPPAALMPQGELANSPTQPVSTINPELFGLPKGELLIGDMNQSNLVRYIPDEVDGVMQGTVLPFISSEKDLGIGNNRLAFTEDGALWLGKMHYRWAGDIGLKKITWNKKPFLFIEKVSQVENGFEIIFSQPLSNELPKLSVTSHTYHYHVSYGSEKVDLTTYKDLELSLDKSKKKLTVTLDKLTPKHLYMVEVADAVDQKNRPLMGDIFWYNLINIKK